MVNGSDVPYDIEDKSEYCFLPLFRNNLANMDSSFAEYENKWIAGVRVMALHYLVYDMETSGTGGTYRLGIAPKNPEDKIGQDIVPDSDSEEFQLYFYIMVGTIAASAVCLTIFCCQYQRRKEKSNEVADILDTNLSDDDDGFNARQMLKSNDSIEE